MMRNTITSWANSKIKVEPNLLMLNLILLILPTIKETVQKMVNGQGKIDFYGATDIPCFRR